MTEIESNIENVFLRCTKVPVSSKQGDFHNLNRIRTSPECNDINISNRLLPEIGLFSALKRTGGWVVNLFPTSTSVTVICMRRGKSNAILTKANQIIEDNKVYYCIHNPDKRVLL